MNSNSQIFTSIWILSCKYTSPKRTQISAATTVHTVCFRSTLAYWVRFACCANPPAVGHWYPLRVGPPYLTCACSFYIARSGLVIGFTPTVDTRYTLDPQRTGMLSSNWACFGLSKWALFLGRFQQKEIKSHVLYFRVLITWNYP